MEHRLLFQYCQKLIIISADRRAVLLARRKDEADYNGIYSFIGGKMETTDPTFIEGLKREKDEEIGSGALVRVLPNESYNVLFRKDDGMSMVLPHIAGLYAGGDIMLSDEYSECAWVPRADVAGFEPKIGNIPELTEWAIKKLAAVDEADLVEI